MILPFLPGFDLCDSFSVEKRGKNRYNKTVYR